MRHGTIAAATVAFLLLLCPPARGADPTFETGIEFANPDNQHL